MRSPGVSNPRMRGRERERENNQEVDERTECPVDELHKGLFSSSSHLILGNKRM